MVTIQIDMENTAETFWGEMEAAFPSLCESLRQNDQATVSPETWEAIQKLEGFADGPAYARTALLVS